MTANSGHFVRANGIDIHYVEEGQGMLEQGQAQLALLEVAHPGAGGRLRHAMLGGRLAETAQPVDRQQQVERDEVRHTRRQSHRNRL